MIASQPDRRPNDGEVAISREGDNFVLTCRTGDHTYRLVAGPFNAWRLFGLLALMLEVKLPSAIGKRIKL